MLLQPPGAASAQPLEAPGPGEREDPMEHPRCQGARAEQPGDPQAERTSVDFPSAERSPQGLKKEKQSALSLWGRCSEEKGRSWSWARQHKAPA